MVRERVEAVEEEPWDSGQVVELWAGHGSVEAVELWPRYGGVEPWNSVEVESNRETVEGLEASNGRRARDEDPRKSEKLRNGGAGGKG